MCHTLHTQSLTASAAPDFDLFPFKVFVRKELIPVFFLTRRNFKRVFLLVANEEMDHLRMAGNLMPGIKKKYSGVAVFLLQSK